MPDSENLPLTYIDDLVLTLTSAFHLNFMIGLYPQCKKKKNKNKPSIHKIERPE